MESARAHHLPLYQYLRKIGYHVRILNGLNVKDIKKSGMRKPTDDSINSERIVRYLMVSKERKNYDYPDKLKNLRNLSQYLT